MRSLSRFAVVPFLAAATLVLAACSERGIQEPGIQQPVDDPSGSLPLGASWSGVADPIELTLTLDRILGNGQLSGSGVLGSVHAAFAFTVDGNILGSEIGMDFVIPGDGTITFQGTLTSDDRIVGVLNGAGFDQFGISLEPVTEGGGDEASQFDPGQPQPGVSAAFAGEYEGDWEILIRWTDANGQVRTVVGVCPGSVWLEQQSLLDRLFGGSFSGSYFIQDAGGCSSGSTVSGAVRQGQLRDDGGVNFGLEIPGSDGNVFEDLLAGSGVSDDPDLLGCAIINKDLENQMDGSILGADLSAAASASLDCPRITIITGIPVNMRVTVDATKTS